MLCELKIENLALIESLHLLFEGDESGSLIVMTGETGAGKSIMLRAIKMLAGERANSDWVRSGTEQCTVEALFEINPRHERLLESLVEEGFADETTVIIKRIITEKGRSRLYVNGSPATAKTVRELTANLLNVASQHDHQQLLQPQLHLDFIDTLGEHWPDREGVSRIYADYRQKRAQFAELRKQEQDKEQKRDFLSFQLEEIRTAALQPGEDEALENEKKRLKSGDTLIRLSQESYGLLSSSVMDELARIRKNMAQIAALDEDSVKLAEDMSEYCFQAEDLAVQLRNYRDSLENDPYRLEQVTERIDLIQGLKRKYGETIEEIIVFAGEAEQELERLNSLEIKVSDLEKEIVRTEALLNEKATALSVKRKMAAASISAAMKDELEGLAFNQAVFEVRWLDFEDGAEDIGPTGMDRVEFYFSANPGEPSRPLAKVASGGELSRLMLAMKCLLAKKDMVETVIFDEVDAGIGGEAAEAVARKIRELSSHHQVFCITHLPQIAARGTGHFVVQKDVRNGRTASTITQLDEKERESEVARMLAGESATVQTHAWARELLQKSRAEWTDR